MNTSRRRFITAAVSTVSLATVAGCVDPQNPPSEQTFIATPSGVDEAEQITELSAKAVGRIDPQMTVRLEFSDTIPAPRHITIEYGTEIITTTFVEGDTSNARLVFHDSVRDGTYRVKVLDSDAEEIDSAYFKFENPPE